MKRLHPLEIALAKICLVLSSLLLAAPAWAATFTLTSPNYTTLAGTGTPAYTAAMHFNGTFTTTGPLPANLSYQEIGPFGSNLISSYSFSDGLYTFTQTTSSLGFSVNTDAVGNITLFELVLTSPQAPNTVGQKVNYVVLFYPTASGVSGTGAGSQFSCTGVNPSANNVCNSFVAGVSSIAGGPVPVLSASPTSVSLLSSINPSQVGQSVTFTAIVGSSGKVTFNDGTTALCSNVVTVGNSASCSTSSLSAGSHAINAAFRPDNVDLQPSSAALTQVVNALPQAVPAPALGGLGLITLALGFLGFLCWPRLARLRL